ncbi:MAG: hypothetical protein Q4B70_09390 [Lachnospiraceae bacterium]|nr:hypothetical protein [Lachnospiraceae bacterium]
MERKKLIEFLECNEPVLEYNGREYGICYPNGDYMFYPTDDEDDTIVFQSAEDLIDNLIIDGVPFQDIADEVFKEYFE